MVWPLKWSVDALFDLRDISDYINEDNPEAAARLAEELWLKAQNIADYPLAGRVVPETRDRQIRETFHGPFRIIYLLTEDPPQIEIIRIWHSARGIPEL